MQNNLFDTLLQKVQKTIPDFWAELRKIQETTQKLQSLNQQVVSIPILPDMLAILRKVQETKRKFQSVNLQIVSTPSQRPSPDFWAVLQKIQETTQKLQSLNQQVVSIPIKPKNILKISLDQKSDSLSELTEKSKWLKLISHPSIILILGKQGSGKTFLGFRLLEFLRWKAKIYVVGVPKEKEHLLPEWIGILDSLGEAPNKTIVLADEASIELNARSSMTAKSKALSELINLSRQKEQTLIFVSQQDRIIDLNIVSSSNVIIFKELSALKFERRQLTPIMSKAREFFSALTSNKKKWAYVYAPNQDFLGPMEHSRATFWREGLSYLFATKAAIIARPPKKISLDQRIEEAKELRQQGLSLGQIAKMLNVTKPTIKNWLEDYPYKK